MIPAAYLEIAVLTVGAVVLMLETFVPAIDKRFLALATLISLTAVFVATFFVAPTPTMSSGPFWTFYAADSVALVFKRFMLATTAFVLLMMIDYAPVVSSSIGGTSQQTGLGEFFTLPVFTCAGLMYLVSAVDLVMVFVSLELVTISFYVLISLTRRNPITLEAGVKYLILSAMSTGFIVYGITWVFGVTRQTNLLRIASVLSTTPIDQKAALFGMLLILVGLGFKIAAVPFQLWVPDVYQGAPTPVTAFLSVGSKAAGFVVLLRVLQPFLVLPNIHRLLVAVALLTLLYGNLAALPQANFKRLLGYSSIAHAGYLLIGVACFDGRAVGFYLIAYLLMTLLSFAVLVIVAQQTGDRIEDFDGLAQRSPFLAFGMLIAMASLAGIPLTAGFFGKFLIFMAAIAQRQTALIVIGAIGVACGFYYYLKVVRAMYWQSTTNLSRVPISGLSRAAILVLITGIVWLGVYPKPVLKAFETADRPILLTSLNGHASGEGSPSSAGSYSWGKNSPVIYDNDTVIDTYTDALVMALASNGDIQLKGMITTSSDIDHASRQKIIAEARSIGFKNIPDAVLGGNAVQLSRPASGVIEDTALTKPGGSDGAKLIVSEARKASPENPLVVIGGGPFTTVAEAYLLAPDIAKNLLVLWSGVVANVPNNFGGYNGWVDPWSASIVMQRLHLVFWNLNDKANLAYVPKSYFRSLLDRYPDNSLLKNITSDEYGLVPCPGCPRLPGDYDGDGPPFISLVRGDYSRAFQRVGYAGTAVYSGRDVPTFAPDQNGSAYFSTDGDGTIATMEYRRAIETALKNAGHRQTAGTEPSPNTSKEPAAP